MPLYDQEKMVKLVSQLRRSVARLRELGKLSEDVFIKDPDKLGSSKYHFIVAIESAIDMCNHIIARNGYRVPEDYGDTFRVMGEVGAMDGDFAEELAKMAKFRNRLVHLYWEVDDEQVYEIIQKRLDDFKKLLNSISSFLGWDDQLSRP
ncbi:MAG: DUF86 domain-containing protein [Deltaproteobacteria bacterium]|nr:DUF86 domain-containing protein [Deltaproteobacteria bacterium]